jgi:Protein ChrB, N-terminal
MAETGQDGQWVLLAYRLPRVPSTPRSTIWRKLKRLGVAQISDGLVALPADARTREALEWIADEVLENDGEATIWLGHPADAASTASIRDRMSAAVVAEYAAVADEAAAAATAEPAARRRIAARLRRELHRIEARDFFAPAERETAGRAVDDLARETRIKATPARTRASGVRP